MMSNPRYAAIVVDVKTGRTLYEAAPEALRHPASITKVMTLYLLFEQLQAGRITMATPLPVSAHAASQSPTKLGLRAGQTIRVDDAIKGIVTRSANDAAVVVAEALGGSEANFAQIMTRKARALGMVRTQYVNASGLPDDRQITTAHDIAILGMAIQKRFPAYYRFFATKSFVFRGREIGSHNHLLGSVDGVDGIKTGYTTASGFNILTNVRRDNRQLIAVVMGGRSAASRDVVVRRLIDTYMPSAYAGAADRSVPQAEVAQTDDEDAGASSVAMAPQRLPTVRPAVVAEAPKSRLAAPVAAPLPPQPVDDDQADAEAAPAQQSRPQVVPARPAIAATAPSGPTMRWVQGPQPVTTAPATPPVRAGRADEVSPDTTATVQTVRTVAYKPDDLASPQRSGWIIQIGATDNEGAARQLLSSARAAGSQALASARPFTETVNRNGATLYRARFGGFADQRQAQTACSTLKAASFSCVAVKL
ncbi:SPOR domain-containing protein [Labrys okinawensis]|uniref:SPOR domain-containing protein n=1 Tax=Labrys okinawensis TaxID=346911 RepID=UPI0039BD7B73